MTEILNDEATMQLVREWAVRFVLTQAVELPVYWFALARRPVGQRLAIGFAASTLTHPLLVFVLHPLLRPLGPWPSLLVGEALVVLLEGAFLRCFTKDRPFAWALFANALSVAVGGTVAALLAYVA